MDKNKFQVGKVGKTGKAGVAIAIIIALIGIGLRVMRIQARQERRESQSAAVSVAQSLAARTSSSSTVNATASSIMQSIAQAAASSSGKTSSNETVKYDKYTPVDGTFSLGQIGNNFYVVDPKTQQRTPLDNATEAYVVEINNQDRNSTFGAIVAKIDNEWLVYVNEAKKLGSLGEMNITEKTRRIIIKNGDAIAE